LLFVENNLCQKGNGMRLFFSIVISCLIVPTFIFCDLKPSSISLGVIGADEAEYYLEIERYFSKASLVLGGNQGYLNSKETKEIFLGVRYFPRPNHLGHFWGLGMTSLALSNSFNNGEYAYFFEFGGRMPIRKKWFITVATKLDYLTLESSDYIRATLSGRLGYEF